MNYLAHIVLSGADPRWQLGGYLGDFVKGSLDKPLLDQCGQPWGDAVIDGIRLHRLLDAEVETLPEYRTCVALLGPEFRRVGGIAIDVLFDHLLVNHWHRFSDEPLPVFSRRFYRYCEAHAERLPHRAAGFIEAAARHDLFLGYGERQTFLAVMERIERRLRYRTNLLAAADRALQQLDQIETQFIGIMPVLLAISARQRRQLMAARPNPGP